MYVHFATLSSKVFHSCLTMSIMIRRMSKLYNQGNHSIPMKCLNKALFKKLYIILLYCTTTKSVVGYKFCYEN